MYMYGFFKGGGKIDSRSYGYSKEVVWGSLTWKDFSEVMVPELSWGVLDRSRRICFWRLNIESTGVFVGNCVGAVGQDGPPGMVPTSKLGM